MSQYRFGIEELYLVETGTYNDQWRRPYKMGVSGHAITTLEERLGGNNSLQITPALLSGITSQIIQPDAVPEDVIKITNGWGEKRMRFNMKVHVWTPTGGHHIEIIQGFTDYIGATNTGALAQDMTFYINSITHVREIDVMTPMGSVKKFVMSEPNHLLSNESSSNDYNNRSFYSAAGNFKMRPEDVFSVIPRMQAIDDPSSYDDTVRLGAVPCMSKMSSATPATYTARILSGYKNAASVQDFGQGYGAICGEAKGYVGDSLCSMEPFIKAIAGLRGVALTTSFNYRDLATLDPNVTTPGITKCIFIGATKRHTVHHVGETDNWGQATLEAQLAATLSQAIPGIAIECSLSLVEFSSTNRTFNMMPETAMTNARSIMDMDLSRQVNEFVTKLNSYVMHDISQNGLIDYAVVVSCDINGDTRIQVSIAGNPPTAFVTPSFACALTVPLLTSNATQVRNLAEGFEQLMSSVVPPMNDELYGSFQNNDPFGYPSAAGGPGI